jgi:arylsulfatase A-like enzyme
MSDIPNILIIMVDQQRYDCIGCSGDYPVRTPHIDRLAAEGIRFTNAYTPIPLCGPSRQAFMTGRRPESFGSLWNYNNGLPIPALEPDSFSWARELKPLGYRSAYLGKWGVHPKHDPTAYGFDRYVSEDAYKKYRKDRYPTVQLSDSYFGETDPVPLEDASTHWLAGEASREIRSRTASGEPWHIRLNFAEPHLPCRPSGRFADAYAPEAIPPWRSSAETFENKPYIQKQQLYNWQVQDYTWDDWAPVVARYYGMISQVDDAIGSVLQTLDDIGIADDTFVVYTSDHGDLCGGHRMMDKHYVLYDDVVKVPLILRWPGRIDAGRTSSRFVSNMLDIPPTVLELLGQQIPDFFHGRSLLPLLQEGSPPAEWRNEAVSTYNGQQFGLYTQRMIRTDRWKYVWNTTDVDELYDLHNDPDELTNRIYETAHAEVLRELRERLYTVLLAEGDGLVRNEWLRGQLLFGRKL